ncbi:MAG TPA: K(+)-transporting ATPase subunit C [Lentimicrobium sp.]|nr:K(+)-transporting ATPase subunit C [Bacteroidales bacterium]HLO91187.1 K(+)-transporting ATPase subunit C [Lentimicrobium sp.]
MKANLVKAIRLTLVCIVFFPGIYTLVILGIAQVAPNHGKGFMVTGNNKAYYLNIGQPFTKDRYFWSRPSAVGYNAAGSGGSNKGPSNPGYLVTVSARIDQFLLRNPGIERSEIPADLVTASGSGLDPHISVQAAKVQVKRIAAARNIPEDTLINLISRNTRKPLLGLFGPECVNVLMLNLDLDKTANNH